MRKIATIFTLLITFASFAQEINVMSYNIRCGKCDEKNSNNWDSRKELVLTTIKKENPDIIGFQEMITEQREYMLRNLPSYSYYGTGRDADGQGEGCYIFYKTKCFAVDSTQSTTNWYSSTPTVPGSGDMGDLYKRIVTYIHLKDLATNKSFYFFNTHLTYIDEIQEKHIEFLTNVIKNRKLPDSFILTGDFNAEEKSKAIQLVKHNFETSNIADSYRIIHPTGDISTYNDFTGARDRLKIDYIFIDTKSFKTLDAKCISKIKKGKYPSDHYPITAKLKLIL